jgi:hypothetical protein
VANSRSGRLKDAWVETILGPQKHLGSYHKVILKDELLNLSLHMDRDISITLYGGQVDD